MTDDPEVNEKLRKMLLLYYGMRLGRLAQSEPVMLSVRDGLLDLSDGDIPLHYINENAPNGKAIAITLDQQIAEERRCSVPKTHCLP